MSDVPEGMYEAVDLEPFNDEKPHGDMALRNQLARLEQRLIAVEKVQRRHNEKINVFQKFISAFDRVVAKLYSELDNKIDRRGD